MTSKCNVINMAWYKTVFARGINHSLIILKSSFYTQKEASKPGIQQIFDLNFNNNNEKLMYDPNFILILYLAF